MKLQVLLLAAAQALFQTASVAAMFLNVALLPWLAAAFLALLALSSVGRLSARIKA